MTPTFLWLMLGLKIPIIALLTLVWWAVKQTPEPTGSDGGSPDRAQQRPHPRRPHPRRPRRGPHGAPAMSPPPRVRSVTARGRRMASRTCEPAR